MDVGPASMTPCINGHLYLCIGMYQWTLVFMYRHVSMDTSISKCDHYLDQTLIRTRSQLALNRSSLHAIASVEFRQNYNGLKGGGPRVVVSTAAFHARVRGSVPGLGGLKETKNVSSPSTCESQYCGEPP